MTHRNLHHTSGGHQPHLEASNMRRFHRRARLLILPVTRLTGYTAGETESSNYNTIKAVLSSSLFLACASRAHFPACKRSVFTITVVHNQGNNTFLTYHHEVEYSKHHVGCVGLFVLGSTCRQGEQRMATSNPAARPKCWLLTVVWSVRPDV